MYVAPIIFVVPGRAPVRGHPVRPEHDLRRHPGRRSSTSSPISSLPVLATFMAGWSANNKYSLFGAMRIVAMTISYEVAPRPGAPRALSLFTGTLSLQDMVLWQNEFDIWMIFVQPLAFVIYFICVSAELNRTPDGHRRSRIGDRRRLPHRVLGHEVGPLLRHGHRLRARRVGVRARPSSSAAGRSSGSTSGFRRG